MSVHFSVDRASGTLHTVFEGVVTPVDLLAAVRARGEQPADLLRELVDLRDCRLELDMQAVRTAAWQLREAYRDPPEGIRSALVGPDDVAYGLLRGFAAFRSDEGVELAVFRDRMAALDWLRQGPD
jgi:hypothetical protein